MVEELALKEAAGVNMEIHAKVELLSNAHNVANGPGLTTPNLDVC